MGELHLEIVRNKVASDYKIEAELGRMRVSYRETISNRVSESLQYQTIIKGKESSAAITVELEPLFDREKEEEEKKRKRDKGDEATTSSPLLAAHCEHEIKLKKGKEPLSSMVASAVLDGVKSALNRGPLMGFQLMGIRARVVDYEETTDSSTTAFQLAAAEATRRALQSAIPVLLEPIMNTEVTVSGEYVGDVLSDLTSRRRASIREVNSEQSDSGLGATEHSSVLADVPLAEMVGYATSLRSRTKGMGAFSMEYTRYEVCSPEIQTKVLSNPF